MQSIVIPYCTIDCYNQNGGVDMVTLVIPSKNLAEYISELARKHGVKYVRTASDALAEVITRLSGDDVTSDNTEDIIVALKRADVIDGPTMISLLGSYLDEKRSV